MAETARNTKFPNSQREVEMDPLTWPSGLKRTRARVAAEYWLGSQRIQKRMHEMNIPFIAFHGRDDPMTDPESSAMLHRLAASRDKSLQWVDNVFHDLMHEKPISDEVCMSIKDWLVARASASAAGGVESRTTRGAEQNKTRSTACKNRV